METFEVREPLMLISVARSYHESADIYEIARYAWRVDVSRAREVDLVLAHRDREVVGAFRPDQWLPATRKNFPGSGGDLPGRFGFIGRVAEPHVEAYYVGKRVPAHLLSRSPVRYCAPE